MKGTPLVSVIVPVYNNEKFLTECLNSILDQTYTNIEIIAVDDGSDDSCPQILKTYADQITILTQNNGGASSARNTGIAVSSGELLAFLDSDDVSDKNKLERCIATLNKHPDAVGVYHDVRYIDSKGLLLKATDAYRMAWSSGQILEPLIAGKGTFGFSPSVTVIRKRYCMLVDSFDKQAKQCEDYGLWLKLALHGPFLYLSDTLSSYRRHAGCLTTSKDVHYQQLHGRYLALLSIQKPVIENQPPPTQALYNKHLYECACALGYWARIEKDTKLSIEAYQKALTLEPLSPHVLLRLIILHLMKLRSFRARSRKVH